MSNNRELADLISQAGGTSEGVLAGRRNLIINGGFDVWQRGTSGFGHSGYFADRWREDYNTGNGVSISKYEIPSGGEAGLPNTFTSAMKYSLTVGSGGGLGLNDVRQRIEKPKMFDGQTVTLSYYVKASSNCTVNNRRIQPKSVTNAFSGASLPAINVTTEWQKVTDTVTFGTSSTAVYSASSYLDVVISAPVATTVDIDYYVTGVQLEVGSVATPFEHRSYGEELALCQRYFNYIKTTNASGSNLYYGNNSTGVGMALEVDYPPMRAEPSITYTWSQGSNVNVRTGIARTWFWGTDSGGYFYPANPILLDAEL